MAESTTTGPTPASGEMATEMMPVRPAARAPSAEARAPSAEMTAQLPARTGERASLPAIEVSRGGMRIGHFELIREIARGGMGQVFLARDTRLGRKVAIKFLLYSDPEFVQRFFVEARATARCTHENIVTIFEFGEHEGLPFMVLEYLEGRTLSDQLDARISPRQLAEILVSVARALERAHAHGIVHRDLKPSNIFITDRGQVKVLDFGVARLGKPGLPELRAATEVAADPRLDDAVPLTVTITNNSLIGTLPYMSPEQWGADEVDHRSDLWAIGIMLWRALGSGHPTGTFAADGLRAALTRLDVPLPSLATQDPTLPAELVAIADRCLQKRKADRYQSATEVVTALQAFLTPRSERLSEGTCPYRGLAAFGENDARYFFGRTNEIRTALAQLASWPLLAVIGPSGVGKSSFVHAGLIPALRAAGGAWQIQKLRPGRVPLHRLAGILDELRATGERPGDVVAQLEESPGLFGDLVRAAAARRGQRVLIVVDQLEELFTLCESDATREVFLAVLLAAADDPSSPVRLVLSMRADFLDRFAGHKRVLEELSRGMFFLSAPDRDNLRESLVRPAELAGYAFDQPAVVEDMLDAATSRGALPLLSFAATRLWDARDRERKRLTASAYQQMGGVAGAFARHADQVAAAVPASSQILLRAILTRLVTPDGTRAIVDRKELQSLSGDPREIESILDQLVRARLVHLHTEPDQGATVEIIHETLISEWPTLRRWLDDSHALRGFVHELGQAARQWDARGRPVDLVWRGATAHEALANVRRHVLDLSAAEKAFVEAIRQGTARARQRKLLVVGAALVGLTVALASWSSFTVKLSRANADAQAQAREAERAKLSLQQKLDIIAEKEQARLKAEAETRQAQAFVVKADEDVKMSREELERANASLRGALARAQEETERAEQAAGLARQASEEAKAARAEALAAAEAERARADELARESRAIFTKGLRRAPSSSGSAPPAAPPPGAGAATSPGLTTPASGAAATSPGATTPASGAAATSPGATTPASGTGAATPPGATTPASGTGAATP